MTAPKKQPGAGAPPAKCPGCGTSTAENFVRPNREGLHCHRDDATKWAKSCGIVLCACGIGYAKGAASKTQMKGVA